MRSPLGAVAAKAILAWVLCAAAPAFAGARNYNKDFDVYTDIVYGHEYALAMTMDAVVPKKGGNGAAVVWIVSGGWHSGLFPPWAAFSPDYPYAGFFDCRALLDKGFAVFFVRHGDGSKFPMPEIVDDCRRAIRFLRLNARKYNVDPDRLGTLGGSAGGHLVLMLSTTSDEGVPNPKNFDWMLRHSDRIATAVAYYPPTDIRDWWATGKVNYYQEAFKFDPKRGAEFSPLLWVTPYSAPALMIHGDKDVIPITYSQDILAQYKKHGVPSELLTVKGVGHGFDIGFKGFKDYTPAQLKILETTRSATVAWFEGNSQRQTHDVGIKAPNAWGLYDMCGNVSQWCLDLLDFNFADATDPVGPAPNKCRGGHILRGGYWSMPAYGCRSAARDHDASAPNERSNVRYNVCGFRLALPAE